MKNEGWGFKEDQIPSSSHGLHQTMDSHLHIQYVPTTYKKNELEIFFDNFFIRNNSLYFFI
jgi:hypothetical protein